MTLDQNEDRLQKRILIKSIPFPYLLYLKLCEEAKKRNVSNSYIIIELVRLYLKGQVDL